MSFEDLAHFEQHGYVRLPEAFSRADALAIQEVIWSQMREQGIDRYDRSTWPAGVWRGLEDHDHEHDFDAFRQDLKTLILNRAKPALISEADLFDPCNGQSQPEIPDKGGLTANQNGASAAWSIKQFISQEQGAKYVAIWNFTNGYSDNGSCPASGNDEYAWHAAYVSYATYERYWFYQWWMDTNQP